MLCASVFCLSLNYYLLRRSRLKLQELATNNTIVELIDGTKMLGSELIPGDRFYVKDKMKMNCDCLLLSGDILINEATLTGESVPVPK